MLYVNCAWHAARSAYQRIEYSVVKCIAHMCRCADVLVACENVRAACGAPSAESTVIWDCIDVVPLRLLVIWRSTQRMAPFF